MRKTEHLLFLVLMIPSILIVVAAAVSIADREIPARPTYAIATAFTTVEE